MTLDSNGNLVEDVENVNTKHYWGIKKMEKDVENVRNDIKTKRLENALRQAKLMIEYNLEVTDPELTEALTTYKDFITGILNDATGAKLEEWKTNGVPQSLFELQVMSKRLEADVADNTAKGYKADSMYKVYRSLQELMFALTNSKIIDTDTNSTYTRILNGMEKAMNGQVGIWGYNLGIDLDDDSVTELPTANTPI
mgnify:CR=1 FL=1